MLESTKRAILQDIKRMSYSLVAEKYGLTRNQVAGIVWREKNPKEDRIYMNSKGERSGGKCGRGAHGRGKLPPKTLPLGRPPLKRAADAY